MKFLRIDTLGISTHYNSPPPILLIGLHVIDSPLASLYINMSAPNEVFPPDSVTAGSERQAPHRRRSP